MLKIQIKFQKNKFLMISEMNLDFKYNKLKYLN